MKDSQKDQEVRYLENKTTTKKNPNRAEFSGGCDEDQTVAESLEWGLKANSSLRSIDTFLSVPSETSHMFMCQLAGATGVLPTAENPSTQPPEMRLQWAQWAQPS